MYLVSKMHIGPVMYRVYLFGSGYKATYSVDNGAEREVPKAYGFRDGEGAERAAKRFHLKTFIGLPWPRGKAGKWHL